MISNAWPSETIRSVASEIAVLQNIDGGHLPSSVSEFWHQLAISNGVSPTSDIADVAKSISQALGVEFDEDYLGGEDSAPTLSLYEVILATLQTAEHAQEGVDDQDDEDEDASVGLSNFIADVPPLPWTVRETLMRIQEGSLVLNPEWQRGFVWKLQKQRRLIESILLGLPIPSFLFFEDSTSGRVYVIDGRQRLETISRFCSPREKKNEEKKRFRTFNAKAGSPSLIGAANKYYDQLAEKYRIKIERAPLVTFTFRDIPPEHLYQIFKRYNTGAVALNAAEIRNAVYQASPLHGMMFRLGGEYRDITKYEDVEERDVGEALRQTMPKGKRERYGAYDFIGRYFAFRHQTTGSVASATNAFMQRYGKDSGRVREFRDEFINAFNTTVSWYAYPLVEPSVSGSFHAMLATIQLVSTSAALDAIGAGKLSEDTVRERIANEWEAFATKILGEKQNSTLFWSAQNAWNGQLTRTP